MPLKISTVIMFLILLIMTVHDLNGQQTNSLPENLTYMNWIDAGISAIPGFIPGGSLYIFKYGRKLDKINDVFIGLDLMNQGEPYPGSRQKYSVIFGYRRYILGNLHVEVQFIPGSSQYYSDRKDFIGTGFSVWNEYRAGYRFDILLFKIPFFINLQGAVGFNIYNPDEPKSFIEKDDWNNPLFHIFPDITVGIKF